MKLQHFVLTRFNVASPGREVAIRNAPGWLERRFDLFERYCLPSVAANTGSGFTWLIYFDAATPDRFRQRIEAAQRDFGFKALFVDSLAKRQVIAAVEARLDNETGRVLTTRLDNDDAVASDFLARIACEAQALPDGTVINFPHGVALRNGRLYSAQDASNPFTSLVEGREDLQTIWSAQHQDLARKWKLVQVDAPPCWLQVVHGDNVTNRIKGRRLRVSALPERFVIRPPSPLREAGAFALALDRLLLHPARRARERAIGLGKQLRAASGAR